LDWIIIVFIFAVFVITSCLFCCLAFRTTRMVQRFFVTNKKIRPEAVTVFLTFDDFWVAWKTGAVYLSVYPGIRPAGVHRNFFTAKLILNSYRLNLNWSVFQAAWKHVDSIVYSKWVRSSAAIQSVVVYEYANHFSLSKQSV